MADRIKGIEGIGSTRESREAGASALAGSLYGSQMQGIQMPMETGKETSEIKGIKDKVSLSETEKVSGSTNLDALKGTLQAGSGQGFEQGMQPSFALNSISGVQAGLEPGLQSSGIFKSPPDS